MTSAGLGQVGEAFIALRYRLDTLEGDLRRVDTTVNRQVARIGQSSSGAFATLSNRIGAPFDQLQARLGVFAGGISGLKAGLVGLFAGAVIGQVKAFGEAIAEAGVQMSLIQQRTASLSGERDFFDRLAVSANRLGLSVADAAESTQRFLVAREALGLTTDEVIRLNETIVNLGRLGGSSAASVSAGAQQLAQALAAGQLSGDELRSIMENLPLVAKQIAEGLGVSVGQLKKMGAEGKLAGRDVAGALLGAFDKVNGQIAKLPETLEQSSARFESAWSNILARLDQMLGVSALKRSLSQLGTSLLETFNVKVLGTNDLGTNLRVAAKDAAALRDELVRLEAERSRLANLDPVDVAAAQAQGVELSVDTSQIDAVIAQRRAQLTQITQFLKETREDQARVAQERKQEVAAAPQSAAAPSKNDLKAEKASAKLADARRDAVADAAIESDAQRRLAEAYTVGADAVRTTTLALEAEAAARSAGIALGSEQYQQLLAEVTARDAAEQAIDKARETRAAEEALIGKIADAERDLAQARLEASGAGISEAGIAARQAELDITEAGIAATSALGEKYIETARQAGALRDATKANEAAVADYNAAVDDATAQGERFGDVFANAAEDALFSFDSLGASMQSLTEDLAKLIVRMLVLEPLVRSIGAGFAGFFGPQAAPAGGGGSSGGSTGGAGLFAKGGAFFGGHELTAFAKGGIVNKPTLFPMARGAGLMGEAGPEAVLPLSRTSDGSLGVKTDGLGGGGGGDVTVNVIDQRSGGSPPVETRESRGNDGSRIIDVIVREVGGRIGRGDFDRQLEGRYGMRPGVAAV